MDDILTLLGSYAFPIVMCIAFFWYMIQKDKMHKGEIETLETKNAATYDKLNDTIINNTTAINSLNIVITKLVERMGKDG